MKLLKKLKLIAKKYGLSKPEIVEIGTEGIKVKFLTKWDHQPVWFINFTYRYLEVVKEKK